MYKHKGPFQQFKYRAQFVIEDMKQFLNHNKAYNTSYPMRQDPRSKSVLSSMGDQFLRPELINESSVQ